MYSFLAVLGANASPEIEKILEHSAAASVELVPSIEGPLSSRIALFPEIAAGWMIIEPKS